MGLGLVSISYLKGLGLVVQKSRSRSRLLYRSRKGWSRSRKGWSRSRTVRSRSRARMMRSRSRILKPSLHHCSGPPPSYLTLAFLHTYQFKYLRIILSQWIGKDNKTGEIWQALHCVVIQLVLQRSHFGIHWLLYIRKEAEMKEDK